MHISVKETKHTFLMTYLLTNVLSTINIAYFQSASFKSFLHEGLIVNLVILYHKLQFLDFYISSYRF